LQIAIYHWAFVLRFDLNSRSEAMRKYIILGLLPILAACSGLYEGKNIKADSVSAELMMGDKPAGSVIMTQSGNNVILILKVEGLKSGSYGMHIHETGACNAPGYKSAGGHWNPAGRKHGLHNPDGPHAGDMENLIAKNGHTTRLKKTLPGMKLMGEGGMMDADGAALVIHAGPDDMKTDPSGNSGGRIICGAFKIVG
jgi:superoxide dismutase, Cu-Zn family